VGENPARKNKKTRKDQKSAGGNARKKKGGKIQIAERIGIKTNKNGGQKETPQTKKKELLFLIILQRNGGT